jgi:osmotically-inducible protein OsmY
MGELPTMAKEESNMTGNTSFMRTGKILLKPIAVTVALLFLAVMALPRPTAAAPDLSDRNISMAVSNALMVDDGVSGYLIDVETAEGIVTLSGEVNNILARDRAARLASTVKGVRSVVNEVEVTPTGRRDAAIRNDVETALLMDPATSSWEIGVSVDDATVTLTGSVDSWQEKQLAAKVAKGIRGVRETNNEINVTYDVARTDYEIQTEVEGALDWDPLIDDAMITVGVTDGVVELSGIVGSAAEKNNAIADAWVAGVEEVQADALEVESWARDERFRTQKYVTRNATEIRDAVEDALLYDPRVRSFNVDVDVDGGVVTLSGKVDNLKAKRAAAQDARNTLGVWGVKNHLAVRPDIPDDATLAKRVREALLRDPYVSRYEVVVSAKDGKVILEGDVDSYFEKARADDAAARVEGVVAVDNNLDVGDEYEVLTYDPFLDEDWYLFDYDWYTYPDDYVTTLSDWEIEQRIEDEIFWSPYVDDDEVTVEVDNGVATLTGQVETWTERHAATQNAYQGGAVLVDNDITVEYGPIY